MVTLCAAPASIANGTPVRNITNPERGTQRACLTQITDSISAMPQAPQNAKHIFQVKTEAPGAVITATTPFQLIVVPVGTKQQKNTTAAAHNDKVPHKIPHKVPCDVLVYDHQEGRLKVKTSVELKNPLYESWLGAEVQGSKSDRHAANYGDRVRLRWYTVRHGDSQQDLHKSDKYIMVRTNHVQMVTYPQFSSSNDKMVDVKHPSFEVGVGTLRDTPGDAVFHFYVFDEKMTVPCKITSQSGNDQNEGTLFRGNDESSNILLVMVLLIIFVGVAGSVYMLTDGGLGSIRDLFGANKGFFQESLPHPTINMSEYLQNLAVCE
jgi:hypothetical protein